MWCLVLGLVVGGVAIAIGAGRAAIWTAFLPLSLRASAMVCLKIVTTFLLASAATFVVALAIDLGTALNVMSELHTDIGDAALYSALTLTVVPNAVLFAGAYLLGPGFAIGTATVASPTAVVLGPLPMFPLLAALPDDGTPARWLALLLLVPPLVAAFAAARAHRLYPTSRWEEGAVRGCAGGSWPAWWSACSPGWPAARSVPAGCRRSAPSPTDVTLHAVVALGLGGLAGGLLATARTRRAERRAASVTAAPTVD